MRRKIFTAILFVVLIMVLMPTAIAASGNKLVALTFDDGPGEHTERLLDGLAQREVSATFFVQGFKAEDNPEIIQRMLAEGHQVANHSYDHPDMYTISAEESVDQFERTDRILNHALGFAGSYYYRAPYGNTTEALRSLFGSPVFYWSLDSEDWLTKNEGMIRNKLITEMFDGAIVLLHDTVSESVVATLDAVDHLQKQGYEFVSLKELFRRRGACTEAGKQYYSYLPTCQLLPSLEQPEINIEEDRGVVRISLFSPSGAPMYYTVDGSAITYQSNQYEGSFIVTLPCTIRAVAALDLNGSRSRELVITYTEVPSNKEIEQEFVQEDLAVEEFLTRAELASALYRVFGDQKTNTEMLFEDVEAHASYAEAVTWGYYSGLFSGTGDGRFEPDREISRQELAKVLAQLLDLQATEHKTFADEHRIEEWAREAVYAVTEAGIMEADEYFDPYAQVSMEEFELVMQSISG